MHNHIQYILFLVLISFVYYIYYILCLKKLKLCIGLYFCICSVAPFYLGFRLSPSLPIISLDRILLVPIVFSFIFHYRLKKRKLNVKFPFHVMFFLIFISSAISISNAAYPSRTLNTMVKVLIEYYLISFMIYNIFDSDNEGIIAVFNKLLLTTFGVALYSFIESRLGYNPLSNIIPQGMPLVIQFRTNEIRLFSHRVNSIFTGPIVFASYLVLSVGIVNFRIVEKLEYGIKSAWRTGLIKDILLLVIFSTALLLTGTRGCWVAAFCGVLLTLLFAFRARSLPIYYFIAMVLCIIILPFSGYILNIFINHVLPLFRVEGETGMAGYYRISLINEAIPIIRKVGFAGIGAGNYDWAIGRSMGFSVGDLCNQFLIVGIEQGIIGMICYTMFFLVMTYSFITRWYKARLAKVSQLLVCITFGVFFPYLIVLVLEGEQFMMTYFIIIISLMLKYIDNELSLSYQPSGS